MIFFFLPISEMYKKYNEEDIRRGCMDSYGVLLMREYLLQQVYAPLAGIASYIEQNMSSYDWLHQYFPALAYLK